MATVTINNASVIPRIVNTLTGKIPTAAENIARNVKEELSESAWRVGAPSLGHTAVYDHDITYNLNSTKMRTDNVMTLIIRYNQDYLVEAPGTDFDNFDHTSPIGDHPYNYMAMVNSGNSGYLFGHYPAWAARSGYWDEIMSWSNLDKIARRSLREAGVAYRNR